MRRETLLVVLLAIASLGTTVLIGMTVLRRPADNAQTEGDGQRLFDHPIALEGFELIDQTGEKVTLNDLKGKVWVADFIFTHCPSMCLILTNRMHDLQGFVSEHEHGDAIRLVSISVDPTRDTPEVLAKYAANTQADPKRWTFLTGDRERIVKLIEKQFKLTGPIDMRDKGEAAPEHIIVHTDKFVLVDREGRIRGYYGGQDLDDLERLRRDIDRLFEK